MDPFPADYDAIADWEINTTCNLRCRYCFIRHRLKGSGAGEPRPVDPVDAARGLDGTGLRWLIHITGGEPFLQPDFVHLCRELTRNHYISINTNLTSPEVPALAREVEPERVAFIHCSLHLDQKRNGIAEFSERYRLLRDSGFRAFASQVMYPGNLGRFDGSIDDLRKQGLPVMAKVFRGQIGPRRYPGAYSKGEREIISRHMDAQAPEDWFKQLHLNPMMDRKYLHGELSFRGSPCSAGRNFAIMSPNGEAFRCHGDKRPLGNLLKGEIKLLDRDHECPSTTCPCPYHGISFARGPGTVVKDAMQVVVKRWGKHLLGRMNALQSRAG